ncbi:MAG: hypothetical protein MK085_08590 [Phycisphaerales bacterium]|nr:hypothetical protein [Phycisphaerales bacterium]
MRTLSSSILVASLCAASFSSLALADDPCAGYSTGFESFSGPPDQVGWPLGVSWCMNDASIAGSGFCPTGRALRIADPGDSVGLRLDTSPACTGIRLKFTASSIFETSTHLELRQPSSEGCDGLVLDLLWLPTSGGVCASFDVWLPPLPGGVTVLQWVHGEGTGVFLVDDLSIELEGCCDVEHACCVAGGAGCADAEVAACVCKADPYCCDTAWDELCVELVEESGCGACEGECGDGFWADFGDHYEPGGPCEVFPDLFEACDGEGPWLTISGGCAAPGDVSMRFGDGFPWSTAWTRCLDLSEAVVAGLAFECSVPPGRHGPVVVALVGSGDPWEIHVEGLSTSGDCRPVEVDLSPLLGHDSVRIGLQSGSVLGGATRIDDLEIWIDPPHGACETGAAGCTDPGIEACVCTADAYCCEVAWDQVCVLRAQLLCGEDCGDVEACGQTGNCHQPHASPGCQDRACCELVCTVDPWCCLAGWDDACVAHAEACQLIDGDLDGDGQVSGGDLGILLARWGTADPEADLNGDGVVDAADLGLLLSMM